MEFCEIRKKTNIGEVSQSIYSINQRKFGQKREARFYATIFSKITPYKAKYGRRQAMIALMIKKAGASLLRNYGRNSKYFCVPNQYVRSISGKTGTNS